MRDERIKNKKIERFKKGVIEKYEINKG
jgi:hypothetical protein